MRNFFKSFIAFCVLEFSNIECLFQFHKPKRLSEVLNQSRTIRVVYGHVGTALEGDEHGRLFRIISIEVMNPFHYHEFVMMIRDFVFHVVCVITSFRAFYLD